MAFASASNFIAADNTFNDITGNQINNYSTYNFTVASATQYGGEFDCGDFQPPFKFPNVYSALEEVVNAIFLTSTSTKDRSPQYKVTSETALYNILDEAVAAGNQPLDWRKSIVDLMKILKLNSSFTARKTLALNWGYRGDPSKSHEMNVWLHRHVVMLLVENERDLKQ